MTNRVQTRLSNLPQKKCGQHRSYSMGRKNGDKEKNVWFDIFNCLTSKLILSIYSSFYKYLSLKCLKGELDVTAKRRRIEEEARRKKRREKGKEDHRRSNTSRNPQDHQRGAWSALDTTQPIANAGEAHHCREIAKRSCWSKLWSIIFIASVQPAQVSPTSHCFQ